MQRSPMTQEQAKLALRAMKTVAASDGEVSEEERALLVTTSKVLGPETDVANSEDINDLEDLTTAEAADAFRDEAARRRLLHTLLTISMIDSDFCEEELELVDRFASALDVDSAWLSQLRKVMSGHLMLMRLDMARRIPFKVRSVLDTWTEEPLTGAWDFSRGTTLTSEDPDTAWRFKRLGLLPRGTLGREYWSYMTSHRFLLPGERGAALTGTTYHDFIHVLCDYATDAEGEADTAAFTAGMLKVDDPLALVLGSLCIVHVCASLQPVAAPVPIHIDHERLDRAHRRGLGATADLTEHWDYWSVVGKSIEELQDLYNIRVNR